MPRSLQSLTIDGNSLTIEGAYSALSPACRLALTSDARRAVSRSRALVDSWLARDETIYGVTTGFGEFSNVRISPGNIEKLQKNLIFSHAAGAGEPLPPEVVRIMMLLRANALAKGYSGIRLETLQHLVDMFNAGILPVIPSQGSVGASGDLVQLAHLVLAMMGRGKVWHRGGIIDARAALRREGLEPVRLGAKEGLALINGTQMMTAYGVVSVYGARQLARHADVSAGLSVEALKGTDRAFDRRIQRLRPYTGQRCSADNLRRLMRRSELRKSHLHGDSRVQDAYSLRCIPQVHGASRDAIDYVWNVIGIEINSATDNPLIFPRDGIHLEGGNFHGQPVALAMDFLAIALSELGNISERRTERLVNGSLSGLPRFLTPDGGLNSGFMVAQYTAASIVSENKVLAHPASVDSIPTSANQEDHNSMGSISAQKAYRVLKNVQTIIAIEQMVACQGLDFSRETGGAHPLKLGEGTQAAYDCIRQHIRHLDRDRVLYDDIQASLNLLTRGDVLRAVESAVGPLA